MSKVTLESRQKLPQKIQDVICDVSLAIQNATQASPMTEQMTNTLKIMAGMDNSIENFVQRITHVNDALDTFEEDCNEAENK